MIADVVTAGDWLSDGRRLVSASWDATLLLWDVGEGTPQMTRALAGAAMAPIKRARAAAHPATPTSPDPARAPTWVPCHG